MARTERLNRIKGAIENDFDVRRRCNVASQAQAINVKVMAKILAMPIPVRDEPAPVCGEINGK